MSRVHACALALLMVTAGVISRSDVNAAEPPTILREQVEALQSTVEQQQEELDTLSEALAEALPIESEIGSERSGYNPSRSWRNAYGFADIKVDVHGFINLEFTKAGPDGKFEGNPTFDLHHANLFVSALLRPNLRSHIEIEFEHAFETIEIDQAYLAWGITDWLTLTAGRFYAPFGIERFSWYPPVNHLVSRPLPFRQIIPGNFYQHGLVASGDIGPNDQLRFSYELSVSNGLGGEDGVSDPMNHRRKSRQSLNANSGLAVTSRVAAVFWPWVELGGSIHSQQFKRDSKNQDLLFLGLDVSARWQGFELRAEYVHAALDRAGTTIPGSGGALYTTDLSQSGWYTQLGYTWDIPWRYLDSLVFVVRFDQVELDKHASDERMRLSPGLALQIYQHFRFKAEYQIAFENGPSEDDDAFVAALVIDF